jgi:cysteine desulfurase
MPRIYLDHNATTPLHPAARAAMLDALGEPGNPSSVHAEGRRARELVERARDAVARLVGGTREEIVFTSGGTEANQLALGGLVATSGGRRQILTSAIEHPSVGASATEVVPVDRNGRLDLEALAQKLGGTTAVVSVQLANHEIGVLQDIAAVAERARRAGARVHCDAVQAAGKLSVDVRALGVDAVTVSAHKLGGPKGVGAVWVKDGVDLGPLWRGGHQERERRPGTENLVGIVGFGAAAAAALAALDRAQSVAALRDRFEAGAVALGARVHGASAPRVPNTSNVAFAGVDGELLMEALDLDGVAVSTGAACSSGSLEPSPVILALDHGRGAGDAREAVRVSLGRDTTADEIDRLLALLPSLLERIRQA